jgi:hypothetical protein
MMKQRVTWPQAGLLAAIAGALVVFATSTPVTTQSTMRGPGGTPEFIRADRCYRLTFSIAGSPNWKVLEVQDNGWVKAEIDAGPASALREPVWINTAQIITARDAKCSA